MRKDSNQFWRRLRSGVLRVKIKPRSLIVSLLALSAVSTISIVAHAQSVNTGEIQLLSGVAAPLLLGPAAATPTGYLVGFFKHAYPESSGRQLILVALIAGHLSSVLMTMITGGIRLSQAGISTLIIQGIGAAALSAGINSTNSSGDVKRAEAQPSGVGAPSERSTITT